MDDKNLSIQFTPGRIYFTKDDDVRYVVEGPATQETIDACFSIGLHHREIPKEGQFRVVAGRYPHQIARWLDPSEFEQRFVSEEWHTKDPPEGSGPGFWDGKGEWLDETTFDADADDLPPGA